MINTKKVLLVLLLILIPSLAAITTISSLRKSEEEVLGTSISVVQGCTPYITNLIPNEALVGEEYYFFPTIVGCSSKVDISIQGIEWLRVINGEYIFGIPTKLDIGTHRVEIKVSSGVNSSTYIDYIVVE